MGSIKRALHMVALSALLLGTLALMTIVGVTNEVADLLMPNKTPPPSAED